MSQDRIELVPLSALRDSPFNPRKTYPEAALNELAASIRVQGLLQPVVVRPLPEGEVPGGTHRWELVFGHRRTRAARLADLECIPAILREMTDEQAALAQVQENLQREDVHPLEEADSLARLRDVHQLSVPAIAAGIGKSPSYVYNALRLAGACEKLRLAVISEGLPREVAVEVARLRSPAMQVFALGKLRAGDAWVSYRTAKEVLGGLFTLRLQAAQWDHAATDWPHGAGACTTCPKLAGNDPELAALVPADACTDSECWRAKRSAYAQQRTAELRAQGYKVLTGDEVRAEMRGNYYAVHYTPVHEIDLAEGDAGSAPPLAEALAQMRDAGVDLPKPTYMVDPATEQMSEWYHDSEVGALTDAWRTFTGHPPREDAEGASTPSTAARAAGSGADAAPDDADDDLMADWLPAERAATDGTVMTAAVRAVLRRVMTSERTVADLRVLLVRELALSGRLHDDALRAAGLFDEVAARGHDDDDGDELCWWAGRLNAMNGAQLAALLLAHALADDVLRTVQGPARWIGPEAAARLRAAAARTAAAAAQYGVDLAAIAASQAAHAGSDDQLDDAGPTAGPAASATTGDLFSGNAP